MLRHLGKGHVFFSGSLDGRKKELGSGGCRLFYLCFFALCGFGETYNLWQCGGKTKNRDQ